MNNASNVTNLTRVVNDVFPMPDTPHDARMMLRVAPVVADLIARTVPDAMPVSSIRLTLTAHVNLCNARHTFLMHLRTHDPVYGDDAVMIACGYDDGYAYIVDAYTDPVLRILTASAVDYDYGI